MKRIPIYIYIYLILISILVLLNINNPFFWDKDVLDSKQAHWFLENGFSLILPDHLDPGHPPFVGVLLFILWSVFGKILIVGHLLMWVVAIGVVIQLYKLCSKLFDAKHIVWVMTLILVETSILTQMVVVSSDLILLFFFLLSVNGVLKKQNVILFFGLLGLAVVNLRGMTTAFAIFLFTCYYRYAEIKSDWKTIITIIKPFIIASLPAVFYLSYHYLAKGWIAHNEYGPWQGCYEAVGVKGFFRNLVIYSWRMADAGRIIVWGIFLTLLIKQLKVKSKLSKKTIDVLVLLGVLLVMSLSSSLFGTNLITSRYLIPIFTLLYVVTSLVVFEGNFSEFKKKMLSLIMIAAIASGTFWIYPENVANTWSDTLAHIPYFKLKEQLNEYIDNNNIDRNDVGSYVENLAKEKYYYLNDSEFNYEQLDIEEHTYFFYSNIYNTSDNIQQQIQNNWKLKKEFKKGQVRVALYELKR